MTLRFCFLMMLVSSPVWANSDHQCLTEAIYFEAGSRGENARLAVGHTVLNRVKSEEFPNSICEVIGQGEASRACQFSYRCDGLPEEFQYLEQLEKAKSTALKLLNGKSEDLTHGALFFHSDQIEPGWFATRTKTGSFGGNIFYR